MKNLKHILSVALIVLATVFTHTAAKAGDVLIVEIGQGTTRCGLSSQASPIEFASNINWDYGIFKGQFRTLMNEVYTRLNITNKADHPVLILEPDEMNSYRRVDMADILMGEQGHPWMYVMWNSMIIAYGNDPGTGTVLSYHAEHNHSSIVAVIAGWPYTFGYGVEFNYHEPELVRTADSTFWVTVRCPYADRGDLLNNIVLSGKHWKGISEADINAYEERINIQRLRIEHDPQVRDSDPRDLIIWRAAKKIVNDNILLDWDLAFAQSHYTQNGADYIRRWIF